jgi:hypothetical protein
MLKPRRVKEDLLLTKLHPMAITQFDVQPSQISINEELDKMDLKAEQPQSEKTTISPSELSLKACSREVWYKFFPLDYPWVDPQPPEVRRLWNTSNVRGKRLHKAWQGALAESDLIKLSPDGDPLIEPLVTEYASASKFAELRQRGFSEWMKLDLILDDVTSGEIKGIAEKNFDPYDRYFSEQLKPDQAQLYMYWLDLKKTRYIAINRDFGSYFAPQAVMEFELWQDEDHVEQLLDKAEAIHASVKAGVAPEPAPPGSTYYCKNLCGHFKYCPIKEKLG